MSDEIPRTLSTQVVFAGTLFDVRVDEIELPGGGTTRREVVEHPGAVVVAAVDDRNRVALARQYRHPVRGRLLELPAGTLEAGEEPLTTARRELLEETGLRASSWVSLGSFFSSPGFLREELHAFLARGLQAGDQQLEDDEDIELLWRSLEDLNADAGEIRDAKTLATLLMVRSHLDAKSRGEGSDTDKGYSV